MFHSGCQRRLRSINPNFLATAPMGALLLVLTLAIEPATPQEMGIPPAPAPAPPPTAIPPSGLMPAGSFPLNPIDQQTGTVPQLVNSLTQIMGPNLNPLMPNSIGVPLNPMMGGGFSTSLPGGMGGNAGPQLSGAQPNATVRQAGMTPGGLGPGISVPGGSALTSGAIAGPDSNVQVQSVSGGNYVRITQPGSILSLDLPLKSEGGLSNNLNSLRATELPQLLTSGKVENASRVVVDNGQVRLVGGNATAPVAPGNPGAIGNLPGSSGPALPVSSAPATRMGPAGTTPMNAGPGSSGPMTPNPATRNGPGEASGSPGGPGFTAKPSPGNGQAGTFSGMSTFRNFEAMMRGMVANDLARGRIDQAVLKTDKLLENQYERFYGRKLQQNSFRTPENLRAVLVQVAQQTGTKSAVVYFVFQPTRLEIVVLAPNMPSVYRSVAVERDTLLKLANQFRAQVTNATSQDYLTSGQALYQIMFAPIEALLQEQDIRTLLVVPDSGLRSLPFAALHDGKQFLVEKWSLSLIPSISLTNMQYEPLQDARVLAMGASTFQEQSPLPGVPIELDNIVKELGQGKLLLNQDFTIDNLKAQRQQQRYNIVHLATHGEFQAGTARNSYIQFWDRKLQLTNLQQLQLNQPPLELLVLSACRTAVGDEQAEYGFGGLAVQTGVKSVLASLWYVSDTGTLALMTEFYNQLLLRSTKTEALRAAQIAMIQGKTHLDRTALVNTRGTIPLTADLVSSSAIDLSHPYYWSAFTMIGSPW